MGGLFMRDKMIVYAVIIAIVLVVAPPAVGPVIGGMYLIEEL